MSQCLSQLKTIGIIVTKSIFNLSVWRIFICAITANGRVYAVRGIGGLKNVAQRNV